ncbi:MAG TPA: patatin-like phospholipase family protein [Pyrinomonadaceae bacterium]|nr:patatin-like phospholipase family protein [Pyrinomonadaceae bacterium]
MAEEPENISHAQTEPAEPASPVAPSTASPVQSVNAKDHVGGPLEGIALCLSGGGYRAMLFHTGTIWRLNEAGLLPKLNRVSSVSGGSITAGMLALKWGQLSFDSGGAASNYRELVVEPIRRLAGKTLDAVSVISGALLPGSIADKVAGEYRSYLYGDATLQDLPDKPHFIINATNVQTGSLWRFSKPYMGDWQVGLIDRPKTQLAMAVTASSAFPPVLSPFELDLSDEDYSDKDAQYHREPFTTRVILTDGGVYDNLGLETAWKNYKTILVSDGGGKMSAEAEPKRDWLRHTKRILDLIDNQVRSLRKRQVINSYVSGERAGAYWGIRTNIKDYGLADSLPCDFKKTTRLADLATRLKGLEDEDQELLINWGYAVCDAAIRRHLDGSLRAPSESDLPYPSRTLR